MTVTSLSPTCRGDLAAVPYICVRPPLVAVGNVAAIAGRLAAAWYNDWYKPWGALRWPPLAGRVAAALAWPPLAAGVAAGAWLAAALVSGWPPRWRALAAAVVAAWLAAVVVCPAVAHGRQPDRSRQPPTAASVALAAVVALLVVTAGGTWRVAGRW